MDPRRPRLPETRSFGLARVNRDSMIRSALLLISVLPGAPAARLRGVVQRTSSHIPTSKLLI